VTENGAFGEFGVDRPCLSHSESNSEHRHRQRSAQTMTRELLHFLAASPRMRSSTASGGSAEWSEIVFVNSGILIIPLGFSS